MFFNEKKKNAGAAILGMVSPEGEVKDSYENGGVDDIVHGIAEDLIDAITNKNTKLVVEALKAFLACVQDLDEDQDKEMQ